MSSEESTIGIMMERAQPARRGAAGRLSGLAADLGYIAAGFPLAVISLPLLISLTAASLGLILVWVGVVLLPLALLLASGFAHLSRARLQARDRQLRRASQRRAGARVVDREGAANDSRAGNVGLYRPTGSGLGGLIKVIVDPRRWLDLAFEGLIALPLRTVTFSIAFAWITAGLEEATQWIWWRFLPADASPRWPIQALDAINPHLLPASGSAQEVLASVISLIIGIILLATLPLVARLLAGLDAAIVRALLFDASPGHEAGPAASTAQGQTGGAAAASRANVGLETTDRAARLESDNGEVPPVSLGVARSTGISADASSSVSTVRPAGTSTAGTPRQPVSAWVWASVGVSSLILLAVSWPLLAALYHLHAAVAMVIAIGHSAACLLAVRWPKLGIAIAGAASLLTVILTAQLATPMPWPWPVPVLLTQCLLVLVLALRYSWQLTVGMLSVQVIITAFAYAAVMPPFHPSAANAVVAVSVTAGLAVLGLVLQTGARDVVRAEAAEKLSEAEVQRRKDLQERNRIARELHDVVAHSMSVINVQATTATYRKPGMDPAVEQEFADIAASSRQALGEMRSLLAILRGGDNAPTMPVRSASDIEELIESARTSGAPITASVASEVPAAISPTVYRIVQECLSNALRHAPGADISIVVAADDRNQGVRVLVENSAPRSQAHGAEGAGLGLIGLRERVTTLGGVLTTEPTTAGGYRVVAVLPTLDPAD